MGNQPSPWQPRGSGSVHVPTSTGHACTRTATCFSGHVGMDGGRPNGLDLQARHGNTVTAREAGASQAVGARGHAGRLIGRKRVESSSPSKFDERKVRPCLESGGVACRAMESGFTNWKSECVPTSRAEMRSATGESEAVVKLKGIPRLHLPHDVRESR